MTSSDLIQPAEFIQNRKEKGKLLKECGVQLVVLKKQTILKQLLSEIKILAL